MKIIHEDVVQALLRYLVVRQYSEVFQIIPVLQSLPNAPEEKPVDLPPQNLESTQ